MISQGFFSMIMTTHEYLMIIIQITYVTCIMLIPDSLADMGNSYPMYRETIIHAYISVLFSLKLWATA